MLGAQGLSTSGLILLVLVVGALGYVVDRFIRWYEKGLEPVIVASWGIVLEEAADEQTRIWDDIWDTYRGSQLGTLTKREHSDGHWDRHHETYISVRWRELEIAVGTHPIGLYDLYVSWNLLSRTNPLKLERPMPGLNETNQLRAFANAGLKMTQGVVIDYLDGNEITVPPERWEASGILGPIENVRQFINPEAD